MGDDELIGQQTTSLDPSLGGLDAHKLLDFMVLHGVPDYQASGPIPRVRKFSTGQSNPTFLIDGKYVLRKQPPGARSNSTAHRLDREFLVLKALEKTDVPAPRAIAFCEDAELLNGQFYIMTFVKGRVFSSPALVGLTPHDRRALYRSVVETLVRIHKVDWRRVGLHDFGQCGNMYERQLGSLLMVSDKQEAVSPKVPKIPGRDEIANEMRKRMPDDAVALVMGDFKFDNLLIHPTEPRVVGVLDWELSTIGHPMSDVANLAGSIHHVPYDPSNPSGGGVAGMPDMEQAGIPTEDELLQYYASLTGRPYPDPYWHFYMSFYCWRGAIISQGIGARLVSGQASSTIAELFVAMVPLLAARAQEELDLLSEAQNSRPSEPVIVNAGGVGAVPLLALTDNYTHRVTSKEGFVESMYCDFYDASGTCAGLINISNRPSEFLAETTICLFLADGSTIFYFARPKIDTNNGFNAGGLEIDVLRPMDRTKVRFAGQAFLLKKPYLLRAPETLFEGKSTSSEDKPTPVDLSLELDFCACSPVVGFVEASASSKTTSYDQQSSVRTSANAKWPGHTLHLGASGFGVRKHAWGNAKTSKDGLESLRFANFRFNSLFGLSWKVTESKAGVLTVMAGPRDVVEISTKCSMATRYCKEDEISVVDVQWHSNCQTPIQTPYKRPHEFVISAEDATGVRFISVRGTALTYIPFRRHVRGDSGMFVSQLFCKFELIRAVGFDQYARPGVVGYGMCEYVDVRKSAKI